MDDEAALFALLAGEDAAILRGLLEAAYRQMSYDQRETVFGAYVRAHRPPPGRVDGAALLGEVEAFQRDSLGRKYYAPFNMNSTNYRHIPEPTRRWFARMGELLEGSTRLVAQGDQAHARACFAILYDLIHTMEYRGDVVFAEEYGSWMIPGNKKAFMAAYLTALAATTSPEAFTAAALPHIRRDSRQSFFEDAYASAIRVASPEQRAYLDAEIARQGIKTGPAA